MNSLVNGTLVKKLWSKVPSGQRDSGQRIQTRSVCEQLKAFMKMRHFVLYYKTEVHRAPNFFQYDLNGQT